MDNVGLLEIFGVWLDNPKETANKCLECIVTELSN
jgi:hypothetical protein